MVRVHGGFQRRVSGALTQGRSARAVATVEFENNASVGLLGGHEGQMKGLVFGL